MLLKDIDVEDIILCPDLLDEITFVKSCGRTRNEVGSSYKNSHFFSISMI